MPGSDSTSKPGPATAIPVRALLLVGTRPEAVKMAPVAAACRALAPRVQTTVCFSGQHDELLQQAAAFFDLRPDCRLTVRRTQHTLAELHSRCLEAIDGLLASQPFDVILVQGDTTTVMAAAAAAFYRGVPLVHVEAGLRTGDLRAPFPEEYNRRVTTLTAALHCAPTPAAAASLRAEGVAPRRIVLTGNPVVDALRWAARHVARDQSHWRRQFDWGDRPLVLVTCHRRESLPQGLSEVCRAIASASERWPETQFAFPLHPNPAVREVVQPILAGRPNVALLEAQDYPAFVWLMQRSTVIVTDSGGVQEEAACLGRPVLVVRTTTERPEAVDAGVAELVGTSPSLLLDRLAAKLFADPAPGGVSEGPTPFGDGRAGQRIADLVAQRAWEEGATHVR